MADQVCVGDGCTGGIKHGQAEGGGYFHNTPPQPYPSHGLTLTLTPTLTLTSTGGHFGATGVPGDMSDRQCFNINTKTSWHRAVHHRFLRGT